MTYLPGRNTANLPVATTLGASDLLVVTQGGVDKQMTYAALQTFFNNGNIVESVSGTVVTTAGPIIYDVGLVPWTLVQSGLSAGLQVARNGVVDATTGNIIKIGNFQHVIYQNATTGNSFGTPGWWSWSGTAWVASAVPTA